jgi:hypothetical protein
VRKRARTDDNQAEIVEALRGIGATITSIATLGGGVPDLLVGFRGRNLLLEVKDGRKPPSQRRLTDDELAWHLTWRGQAAVVIDVDEAIAIVTGDPE